MEYGNGELNETAAIVKMAFGGCLLTGFSEMRKEGERL